MKFRNKGVLIITLLLCLTSLNAYGKTYAWLTDYVKKAYKLDVNALKIIQSIAVTKSLLHSSTIQGAYTVADTASNSLFVIYDYPGRAMGQGVRIFNLKDLSFKKDLGITSQDPNFELPKIIVPPTGNKFFLAWWDRSKEVNQTGGETYSTYDKTTLNKLSDTTNFPFDLNLPRMFSSDGAKLWVLNIDANEIRTYDTSTLGLTETISISGIWGSPLYSKGVEMNGKLTYGDNFLFCENIKSNETVSNNIRCFVYMMQSRSVSNKISISEVSNKYLTPDGSKIITNEISYTHRGASISGIKHLNKVRIYSTSSGQQLKYFDFSNTYTGLDVSAISPDGTKLFLVGRNIQTGAVTTIVIDLASYFIATQIPVDASFETFFEDQ
jgi:hypothetical protein